MIIDTKYDNVTRTGNLDTTEAQALTIDASGLAPILNTLTNMYSDPAYAVLREYSSNARDSHVEAGQTRPIEITLPSALSPQLIIQDYGIGMSYTDIIDTYAKYGSSTKRASNELIGALGIGSKSAYTVGNEFVVEGVKDGLKNVALFSRDENGAPTVQILFRDMPVDTPNGVRVEIAVEDVTAFNGWVRLFSTWPQGTVLVDGQEPESVWSNATSFAQFGDDKVFRHLASEAMTATLVIVMGGIPYTITANVRKALSEECTDDLYIIHKVSCAPGKSMLIEVPIGSLDITPNREELRVTDRTKTRLTELFRLITEKLRSDFAIQRDAAKTLTEVGQFYIENGPMAKTLKMAYPTWDGYDVGFGIVQLKGMPYIWLTHRNGAYMTKLESSSSVRFGSDLSRVLVVSDVPEGKVHIVRSYTRSILHSRPDTFLNTPVIIAHEKTGRVGWFSWGTDTGVKTIPYDEWVATGKVLRKAEQAQKVANGTTKSKVLSIQYKVIRNGRVDYMTVEELREEKTVVFGQVNYIVQAWVEEFKRTVTSVVLTGAQKESTFLKRVPNAQDRTARELLADHADKVIARLKPNEKAWLGLQAQDGMCVGGQSTLNWLNEHVSQITNPVILDRLKRANDKIQAVNGNGIDSRRRAYIESALTWSHHEADEFMAEAPTADDDYLLLPLIEYGSRAYMNPEHRIEFDKDLLAYVNSVTI